MNKPGPVVVCLLNDDPAQLASTNQVLLSAGWQTRPFSDPDPFINYARTHSPDIAILDFGGPQGRGLEVRSQLREVSPGTRTIIALKPHHNLARRVLGDNELIDLIDQYVATSALQFISRTPIRQRRKVELGYCA